jgi:hypothetical protein
MQERSAIQASKIVGTGRSRPRSAFLETRERKFATTMVPAHPDAAKASDPPRALQVPAAAARLPALSSHGCLCAPDAIKEEKPCNTSESRQIAIST